MPCASHTKAAEDRETAAKAAILPKAGKPTASSEKTGDATCCCGSAKQPTDEAHKKNAVQAMK